MLITLAVSARRGASSVRVGMDRRREALSEEVRRVTHRRVAARAALLVAMWLLPLPGRAQPLDAFEKLALYVNLGDTVQVQDESAATYTGRLVGLTRRDMAIETRWGERRFTRDVVRRVALREHPLRTSALIGAATFAALGSIAICAREAKSGCAFTGALGAAPVGAGAGLVIGSIVRRMRDVYRTPDDRSVTAAPPNASDAPASLLEDLALQVNLGDRLRVEDQVGSWTGQLTELIDDEIRIRTAAGERRFTRTALRQVRVGRRHRRAGTLIGAGTGAAYGALSECRGGAHADCPGGVLIGGAIGAGAGILVGTLVDTTTVVYPARTGRTFVSPQLSRGTIALTVTRWW
jgi:hypothetical protein